MSRSVAKPHKPSTQTFNSNPNYLHFQPERFHDGPFYYLGIDSEFGSIKFFDNPFNLYDMFDLKIVCDKKFDLLFDENTNTLLHDLSNRKMDSYESGLRQLRLWVLIQIHNTGISFEDFKIVGSSIIDCIFSEYGTSFEKKAFYSDNLSLVIQDYEFFF